MGAITDKNLVDLQKKLKGFDNAWSTKLLERIQSENPEFTQMKIYNVFGLRTKSGLSRIIVYKHARDLLADYEGKLKEATQQQPTVNQ